MAVPAAEIIKFYLPRLVELHNYPPANASAQKVYNWNTFNRTHFSKVSEGDFIVERVLRKIGMNLTDNQLNNLANAKPGTIEKVLHELRQKVSKVGGFI
jgi:uncharacterized protein YpuA (DUF1002 family)